MRNEIGGCGSQPGRPMVVVTTNKGVLILVVVDVALSLFILYLSDTQIDINQKKQKTFHFHKNKFFIALYKNRIGRINNLINIYILAYQFHTSCIAHI